MSMETDDQKQDIEATMNSNVTRREFMKYTAGTVACISLGSLTYGCSSNSATPGILAYPIDSTVKTTAERMITFPYTPASPPPNLLPPSSPVPPSPNGGAGLRITEMCKVSEYDSRGYGAWKYTDTPLLVVPRTDIMADPKGYLAKVNAKEVTPKTRLLNFFAMTDIHITDKEAPNSFIYLQQLDQTYSGGNTSIYSPIMMCTTHVLDAAIQTANALHKKNPFDFFISLGDTCNCTMYNELRWYLDVIDGKVITPSSGSHLGAETIDYQKPYQAAGLDKSIPFYQAIGNHDHFLLGSLPPYETGLAPSFISDTVWTVSDFLIPDTTSVPPVYPAMFSVNTLKNATPRYYSGVIDGSTPFGDIIKAGPVANFSSPPKIAADPNRRSLLRTEWIQEFFNTTTGPVGHGFNLVASNPNFNLVPASERAGFACYSFVPKSNVPLKIIVLDDTQREDDGSVDIHGHGFLDATRWAWLQKELADGQAADQLMIIAAHIPIAVVNLAAETEWWQGGRTATNPIGDPSTTVQNAVTLKGLVDTLWNSPNLLMWMAGHRHLNTVKAFMPPAGGTPDQGFWQVETSSLHDFPQQFRTFEIYLNSDYTVSIVTVNVDPAVAEGTPAAKSRKYSIAAQQIVQNNLLVNNTNDASIGTAPNLIAIPSMDPSRPQGSPGTAGPQDLSIVYGAPAGVPYCASYNAQLFKQLSTKMVNVLKAKFP